jgi:hypothetical protein
VGVRADVAAGALAALAHAVDRDLANPDHAPATERAYAHDWFGFADFCERHDLEALPRDAVGAPDPGPHRFHHAVSRDLAKYRKRNGREPKKHEPEQKAARWQLETVLLVARASGVVLCAFFP